MNVKNFNRAKEIEKDFDVISKLEKRHKHNTWIAFNTPDDKCLYISGEFQDRLMEFIISYKETIEKEFEEL